MVKATKSVPAVAYYRMSSKKQDKSIDAQRTEVEKLAEKDGYRIIRWKPYVDEGISGAESEKRPGFQRLIQDATERDDFEVILC
ncbi:MAG: recombinase family protein [Planctomycetes bacterium]|nr:recombinase family protein [Planctomycetota bacterium]